MYEFQKRLNDLLKESQFYFSQITDAEISKKASPEKWSKKEILGHLIDSGINNLQRFTEIQFAIKPYKMRGYDQVKLVIANDYQQAEFKEIFEFWMSINRRIKKIMGLQNEETLNYKIEYLDGKIIDLRFLMTDYVDHLEHHLNQIKER